MGPLRGASKRAVGPCGVQPAVRAPRGDRDARARGAGVGAATGARRRRGDRTVARGAFDVLRPGGALALEVAAGDAQRVATLLRELGYTGVTITRRDLAGPGPGGRGGNARSSVGELPRPDDRPGAVRDGELVVIPTDTVYGLACKPDNEAAVRALSVLKRRFAGSAHRACRVQASRRYASSCPSFRSPAPYHAGPFTFVLSNQARRLSWLFGVASGDDRRPRARG